MNSLNALPSASASPVPSSREIFPAVYDELRRVAAQRVASIAPGQTLQATALVHEAWLRLAGKEREWQSKTHFFATVAEMIRHILIDHIRSKARLKRGGGQLVLNIEGIDVAQASPDEKVLLIHETLEEFEKEHPDKARVVVLKFFGGLTDREVAAELGVTERTVERYWAYSKAWLMSHIRDHREEFCRIQRQ
jgi:RNA polymerase sigma factor (TIGR02999 family)